MTISAPAAVSNSLPFEPTAGTSPNRGASHNLFANILHFENQATPGDAENPNQPPAASALSAMLDNLIAAVPSSTPLNGTAISTLFAGVQGRRGADANSTALSDNLKAVVRLTAKKQKRESDETNLLAVIPAPFAPLAPQPLKALTVAIDSEAPALAGSSALPTSGNASGALAVEPPTSTDGSTAPSHLSFLLRFNSPARATAATPAFVLATAATRTSTILPQIAVPANAPLPVRSTGAAPPGPTAEVVDQVQVSAPTLLDGTAGAVEAAANTAESAIPGAILASNTVTAMPLIGDGMGAKPVAAKSSQPAKPTAASVDPPAGSASDVPAPVVAGLRQSATSDNNNFEQSAHRQSNTHAEPKRADVALEDDAKPGIPEPKAQAQAETLLDHAAGVSTASAAAPPATAQKPMESPRPAAPVPPSVPQPPKATAASQIAIRLDPGGESGQQVELRIRERAGEVQIAVRSTDQGVATDLRQDLSDLVKRLEPHTSASAEPVRQESSTADANHLALPHVPGSDASRGYSQFSDDAQQQQAQDQQRQRQQQQQQNRGQTKAGSDALEELRSVVNDLSTGVYPS